MKKQSNLSEVGRKLSLGKRTISNLKATDMNKIVGGTGSTFGCPTYFTCHQATCNGQTCGKGNTCYTHKC